MTELWPRISVGSLVRAREASLQTGPFGTQLSASEYVPEGIPVINVRNVGFGDVRADDLEYVSEGKAEQLHHHVLRVGDIVFGRKGAVERHALIGAAQDGWVQGSDCLRLRLQSPRFNVRFVSFYLRTKGHQDWMQALCSFGATMSSLNQDIVNRIELPCPPRPVQDRIAAVLATYDDLIANNRRRVALLESMAEEIYREWFVRLRFPHHATLKGDELTPPGWSRQPIGELAALIKRGVSPDYAERSEHQVINQKCIRGGRLSMAEARPHTSVVPGEKLLRFGDILINSTGIGTLGRAAVFDMAADGVTCDSHVTILRPKDVAHSGEFLAYTIQLLQTYFESMAAGSTGQVELSRELISRTKVLVPASDLLKRFSEAAAPIRKQRRLLLDQNEKLSALRDQLLPRLISGKLRIDALDIQSPPSMQPPPAEAAPREPINS
ncbi:MAG: restriction endonuclease subunit S [Burkholderiales bacterium]|nr:restriction endonuclease subunit S [Burkholderiales bacterium]